MQAVRPLGTAPQFPADALRQALDAVPDTAWGQTSTLEQSGGTHTGYRIVSLVQPGRRQPHEHLFAFVLEHFEPVWSAWLSWLEPGGYILPHLDAGPYHERWQVPIRPAGTLNQRAAVAGVAFRVSHWEPHSVANPTDQPRVHLVLDRELIVDATCVPFQQLEVTSHEGQDAGRHLRHPQRGAVARARR